MSLIKLKYKDQPSACRVSWEILVRTSSEVNELGGSRLEITPQVIDRGAVSVMSANVGEDEGVLQPAIRRVIRTRGR